MLKGYCGYLAGLLMLVLLSASCGGGATAPETPMSPVLAEQAALAGFPGLPMGEIPRESTIISSG